MASLADELEDAAWRKSIIYSVSASDYILPSRPLFFLPLLCGVSTGCGCTAEENQMIIATEYIYTKRIFQRFCRTSAAKTYHSLLSIYAL
jgi:hypothetical protein